MASISVGELRPGMRLAYDLRDAGGRLLLAARQPLTPVVLGALGKRAVRDLAIRSDEELPSHARTEDGPRRAWLMAETAGTGEETPAMSIGDVAEGGDELAEATAGEPDAHATAKTDGLDRRAAEHARELSRLRAALRRSADGVIAFRSPRWTRLGLRVAPVAIAHLHAGTAEEFGEDGETNELERGERVGLVRRMLARLANGEAVGAGAPIALVDELIDEAARRPDALVRSVLAGMGQTDDPAAHAYAVAGVGVAIAAVLGWSREDCLTAGLAGLLADCGVALLPWDIRNEPRELTDVEMNGLRRHTACSAALVELVRGETEEESIPEEVQLAIYQHHERENGSGYPNRARGDEIHDAARVVGVADVLVGLMSARAHRPAMDPGAALGEVARQANAGMLWRPAARALAEMLVDGEVRVVSRRVEGRVAA